MLLADSHGEHATAESATERADNERLIASCVGDASELFVHLHDGSRFEFATSSGIDVNIGWVEAHVGELRTMKFIVRMCAWMIDIVLISHL